MSKNMYCVKCRAKKEGKDKQIVVSTITNKKIEIAKCETCGSKMVRLGVQQ